MPIIAVSGYAPQSGIGPHIDVHLLKPVDPAQVADVLRRVSPAAAASATEP